MGMDYQEMIAYLKSFINYEESAFYSYPRELRLNRVRALMSFMKVPYNNLKYIHIAGSKGKGSVCAMVTSILVRAGYKTGLFTSPHLQTIRERIRVFTGSDIGKDLPGMEGLIPEDDFLKLVNKIKPKLESFQKKSKYGKVTFFEVYMLLAIMHFLNQKVDFVVLEAGLGGKLDATNIVKPVVCSITSVSLEHTDKLGKKLTDIAEQKAGIIKKNSIVVTAPQAKDVMKVLRRKAKKNNAKLYQVGKDILYEQTNSTAYNEIINIEGLHNEYPYLEIPLLGKHQAINAATAIGVIEALSKNQICFDVPLVKEGLRKVAWPGRFELVGIDPIILLDGAQNKASAQALRNAVISKYKNKKILLILGMCRDKKIRSVCSVLSPLADRIFITKVRNPRSALPEDIVKRGRLKSKKVHLTNTPQEALEKALRKARKNDVVLITGSLFLVGELRPQLIQNTNTNVFVQVVRD